MNIKKILKHHGYKSEKDFYKDFPDEQSYINKFGMTPDAYCSGGKMKKYNTGGDIQSGGYMPNLSFQETPIEDIKMASGGIYIKPSKRGTFTAAAKKRDMGVQEFASKVMANKEDYSPAMVKKANFAKNAAKWKYQSGSQKPPIYKPPGDPSIQAYKDSLSLYNKGLRDKNEYISYLNALGLDLSRMFSGPAYLTNNIIQPIKNTALSKVGSSSTRQNDGTYLNRDIYSSSTGGDVYVDDYISNKISKGYNTYKKPVQPVEPYSPPPPLPTKPVNEITSSKPTPPPPLKPRPIPSPFRSSKNLYIQFKDPKQSTRTSQEIIRFDDWDTYKEFNDALQNAGRMFGSSSANMAKTQASSSYGGLTKEEAMEIYKKYTTPKAGYKAGGKLPKKVLKSRLEAHMSPDEVNNYLMQYAMGGYMEKPQYATAGFLEGDKSLKALEMFKGFQSQNKKDPTSLGKGEDILDNIGYTALDMALPGVGTAASIVGELGSQLAENSDSAMGKGIGNFLSTPIAPLGVAKGISAYNEFNRSELNDRIRKDAMKSTLGYNINPYGNYQSGGNLVPLNSTDMKVVGDNPNETDGVDIGDAMLDHNEVYDTEKEFIYSDMKSLKLGNKTPAKLTATISKISGNSDKRLINNPQDKISLATKNIIERMKNKIAESQEYLATLKGYRNPDGSTKQAMKYGGYKPKYQSGNNRFKSLNFNNSFTPNLFSSNTSNTNQSNTFPKLNLQPGSMLPFPSKLNLQTGPRFTFQNYAQGKKDNPNDNNSNGEDLDYKYKDPTGLMYSLAPLIAQSIQFPTKNYLQTLTNEPLGYLQQLPENINIQPALNAITDQRRAAVQNLQQVAPSVQASNIANIFAGTTRAQNELYGNKFNTEAQLKASKLGALSQTNMGMQQFRQQAMDKYVTENNQDKAQRANIRNAALSNAMLNMGKFRSEKDTIDMISNMFNYAKRNKDGEWVIDTEALANAIDLYSQNSTTTKRRKKNKSDTD